MLYICTMESSFAIQQDAEVLSFDRFREEILKDYRLAVTSRQVSLAGRREVLTGKAKFGIFGDGKELPQLALSKFFKPGDWRSGYYRDQTWMLALGICNVQEFFAQLYGDPMPGHDPMSAGRQMNAHFVTPNVDAGGEWKNLSNQYNTAADMAPTAAQMPRSLGLALASKTFRGLPHKSEFEQWSRQGNEVCFCTIGDASTSEGHFWETMNAACVLQVPLAVFVWDDGYGISVPKQYQTAKSSISEALQGFQKNKQDQGIQIYRVKAWDYAGMCEAFEEGISLCRKNHIPVLFHVEDVTQPQGHSTSGSHERYKSPERLEWERQWDCLKKFREWILANELAGEEQLDNIDADVKQHVKESREKAWQNFLEPIRHRASEVLSLLKQAVDAGQDQSGMLSAAMQELQQLKEPLRRDVSRALAAGIDFCSGYWRQQMQEYAKAIALENARLYNTYLYNDGPAGAVHVKGVQAEYAPDAPLINGYEILNRYFDQLFSNHPTVLAFGEDVGKIGDVNQGFAGLQQKHGENRIFDTGIREATIIGQGIGLALRGLRPIAEIQYLDYLLYGLQPLSDDVATLHYRSVGQQSCPLIVRTRGHRLEGIWHSGSPMGMMINSLRGMYICVPRNMVQAAGMYNTLLQGTDPGIVIECLNGYRLKEMLPSNLADIRVPLGVPEIIRQGTDITLVSYGSTLRIVMEAVARLSALGIDAEVVDVQTLLPFDIHHHIVESLKKTNRILFVDEDVPGGAAAFMLNEVMERQDGYRWLDAPPRTLTAQAHRPAYGSDGDYFCKPNAEDVVNMVKSIMAE